MVIRYRTSYDTKESCMFEVITIPSEQMRNALKYIHEKGCMFWAIHDALPQSLQEQKMFKDFKKRAEDYPIFKNSLFTPQQDEKIPEIEFEYLEFWMLSEGVATYIPEPKRETGSLTLTTITKPNLIKLIENCGLPLEESMEKMRIG